jgi:hypothetical protein
MEATALNKKPKSIVLTEPRDIAFIQWARTLPQAALPDLIKVLQAISERWPVEKAYAAALKFLRAAAIRTPAVALPSWCGTSCEWWASGRLDGPENAAAGRESVGPASPARYPNTQQRPRRARLAAAERV